MSVLHQHLGSNVTLWSQRCAAFPLTSGNNLILTISHALRVHSISGSRVTQTASVSENCDTLCCKFVINFLEYLHIYRKVQWVFAHPYLVCLFVTPFIAEPKCHITLNYTLSSNTTDFFMNVHLPQDPIQEATCHLVMVSPYSLLSCDHFLDFPCVWWQREFWGVLPGIL